MHRSGGANEFAATHKFGDNSVNCRSSAIQDEVFLYFINEKIANGFDIRKKFSVSDYDQLEKEFIKYQKDNANSESDTSSQ